MHCLFILSSLSYSLGESHCVQVCLWRSECLQLQVKPWVGGPTVSTAGEMSMSGDKCQEQEWDLRSLGHMRPWCQNWSK